MAVQAANILRGIMGRVKAKRPKGNFPKLSWFMEKLLKHQEDKKAKQLQIGTIHLAYKRPYEVLHTYQELFEDEIYKFPSKTSEPYIIDCGAHIGMSVIYFKKLYPRSRILVFEPDAENFKLLQRNIELNHLSGIELRQSAVWINNGAISFHSRGGQGSQIATEEKENAVTIKAERLADILKEGHVDFLKIDIEGAEMDVINDCEPYLHNVDQLFVEYHGKADEGAKLATLMVLLQKQFSIYLKPAADNLQHPFVQRKTSHSFDVQLNIFCYR